MRRWFTAALAIGMVTGIAGFAHAQADGGPRKGNAKDGERPAGERPRDGERPRGEGDGKRPPSPDELFKRLDKNGDGKIDLQEFLAAPPPPQREGGPKGGPRDGEGGPKGGAKKDGEAAPRGGQKEGKKGPPPREEIFKRLDRNGDGGIDRQEFAAARPPGPGGPRDGEGGKRPAGEGDGKGKRPPKGKGDGNR